MKKNKNPDKIRIGNKYIGIGQPCFIIAEAGSNHDQNLKQAKKLIDVAVVAGADAVKFQTFAADKIAAKTKDKIASIDFAGAKSLFELYKKVELPTEWQQELFDYAQKKGIIFLSTAFDEEAVDQLDEIGVPAFKVASFELNHIPLLKHIARKNKPIILSTGLAYIGEIEEALNAITEEGNEQIAILHCGIDYPLKMSNVNLAAMDTIRQVFLFPVGYSDHTMGIAIPIAAVARGAQIIEKHFTLDRNLPGPDHQFALEPGELRSMVKGIKDTEEALGTRLKEPTEAEEIYRHRGRRSIFAKVDIPKGTVINQEMLIILRPCIGLLPKYVDIVVGRSARRDIAAQEPITWEDI